MTAVSPVDWYVEVETLLLLNNPVRKAERTIELFHRWQAFDEAARQHTLSLDSASTVRCLAEAGRPLQPALVKPGQLARRGLGTLAGQLALLHSLAHIEFNAINLALDAVYRFRDLPVAYVSDWLKVAADEGEHFLLLHHRLHELGSEYGALPAHGGLWEMARRTDHDVLVRMALVPRILEARGLDVAPPMIDKLRHQGDVASAAILERIYTDEITHVAFGNRWFRYLCEQRSLDGVAVFRELLAGAASAWLRSPYNDAARLEAGFTAAEMVVIRQMEKEYRESSSHS